MKRTLILSSIMFALAIIMQMNVKAQKNEPATINANTVVKKNCSESYKCGGHNKRNDKR